MAEPGNRLAAELGSHGHLQASRADREEVVDTLKVAFVQGRLDRDEFDLRVGQALASRTYADLAAITADIPGPPPRPRPPEPVHASVNKKAVVAMTGATAALVVLLPVMLMRPPWPSFVLPLAVVWFVLSMVVPTGWLAVLQDWLDKRADRRFVERLPRVQALRHPGAPATCTSSRR